MSKTTDAKQHLKRRLENSRQEMNLVDLPYCLLSDRAPRGVNEVSYTLQHSGYTRRLTVIGDAKFGLPTAPDEEVVQGMFHLAKEYNDFSDPLVKFSRGELLEVIGWRRSTEKYRRLTTAFDRLSGCKLLTENWWRDNASRQYRSRERVSILDSYRFVDGRARGCDFQEQHSEFTWGSKVFESLQAGYIKGINLWVWRELSTVARRLGQLLDKRANPRTGHTYFEYDLRELMCEQLGASRNVDLYELKKLLVPACQELERIEFLEVVPTGERFQTMRRGFVQVTFRVTGTLTRPRNRSGCRKPLDDLGKGSPNRRPELRIWSGGRYLDELS